MEGKILIVDDTPQNLDVARGLLESYGYETIIATNGEKAIQRAEQQFPDIILLDVQMPGIDGFDTCKALKKSELTQDIPIIFLTAQADTQSVVNGFEAGAVDYVTKPFQAQELIARVNTHIANIKMRKQLENINKSKDKFMSIIAHDLKNPFNAIMGLLAMLIEDFNEFSDNEKLKYLKDAAGSTEKAYRLLENLLSWSRSQFGTLEKYPDKFSVSVMIEDIFEIVKIQAQNKNVSLTKIALDGTFVYADQEMINTVLRNLLTNAIKYSSSGDNIEVAVVKQDKFAEIRVKDYGTGISREVKESLFMIDKVVTTPGTNHEEGSGLGLLLCKEFVETNEGKIWVEDNPEGGTVFKFTVPLSE